jgi:hypothetical protein
MASVDELKKLFFAEIDEVENFTHGARRLQPRRPAADRCSAWLGRSPGYSL